METRVALISIIVSDPDSVSEINRILHDHSEYVIGRMGIPYHEKGIRIISIALDAPLNTINSISGALGRLKGVSSKVTCA